MIPWLILLGVLSVAFPKSPWMIAPLLVMMLAIGGFLMGRRRDVRAIACPSCGGTCRDGYKCGPLVLTCEQCGDVHPTDCVIEKAGPRRSF